MIDNKLDSKALKEKVETWFFFLKEHGQEISAIPGIGSSICCIGQSVFRAALTDSESFIDEDVKVLVFAQAIFCFLFPLLPVETDNNMVIMGKLRVNPDKIPSHILDFICEVETVFLMVSGVDVLELGT